jgi:hypothetical protein
MSHYVTELARTETSRPIMLDRGQLPLREIEVLCVLPEGLALVKALPQTPLSLGDDRAELQGFVAWALSTPNPRLFKLEAAR